MLQRREVETSHYLAVKFGTDEVSGLKLDLSFHAATSLHSMPQSQGCVMCVCVCLCVCVCVCVCLVASCYTHSLWSPGCLQPAGAKGCGCPDAPAKPLIGCCSVTSPRPVLALLPPA